MRMTRTVPVVMAILVLFCALAASPAAGQARATKIRITAEQANLREKPDIGSSIVQQIPEGSVLEADKKEGEWYFVRYALEDGGVIGGWIHESLVEVVETAAPAVERGRKTTERPADRPADEAARRPRRGPKLPPLEFRSGTVPLEISFSAGVGTLAPRDLNDGTRGFVDWAAAEAGVASPGGAQTLQSAMVMGFELAYRLTARWTIALGADFGRGANGGELDLVGTGLTGTVTTKPSVRIVPFKIGARFYPGAGFYARAAVGLYAVKAGYLYRRGGADVWEQWKGSASTSGLGGEAAFGGEWDIAPRTLFFAEAGLRLGGFDGLTGENVYTNSDRLSVREPGRLYYFRRPAGEAGDQPIVLVQGTEPSGEGISEVRQARINISGLVVRVGVRYRF